MNLLADLTNPTYKMSIPDANQDELILKQHEAIKKDISDRTSLVTDKVDLSELEAELSADDLFRAKVACLTYIFNFFNFFLGCPPGRALLAVPAHPPRRQLLLPRFWLQVIRETAK